MDIGLSFLCLVLLFEIKGNAAEVSQDRTGSPQQNTDDDAGGDRPWSEDITGGYTGQQQQDSGSPAQGAMGNKTWSGRLLSDESIATVAALDFFAEESGTYR